LTHALKKIYNCKIWLAWTYSCKAQYITIFA